MPERFIRLPQYGKIADITLRRIPEGREAYELGNKLEKEVDSVPIQYPLIPAEIEVKKKEEMKVVDTKARMPATIKVIGVGGGGCNAVRRMLKKPNPGVEYVICNTDVKSLDSDPRVTSVQIGERLTHGFGAGGDARVGERAVEEGRFALKRVIKDGEFVFFA